MMTESEFLAMSPREQDAAVAEARGWKLAPNDYGELWGVTAGGGRFCVPKFTEDIATAWELVEEMQADGFDGYCVAEGEVYFSKGDVHNRAVLSSFGASSPPVDDWSAATQALHISIAYLKAKGVILG